MSARGTWCGVATSQPDRLGLPAPPLSWTASPMASSGSPWDGDNALEWRCCPAHADRARRGRLLDVRADCRRSTWPRRSPPAWGDDGPELARRRASAAADLGRGGKPGVGRRQCGRSASARLRSLTSALHGAGRINGMALSAFGIRATSGTFATRPGWHCLRWTLRDRRGPASSGARCCTSQSFCVLNGTTAGGATRHRAGRVIVRPSSTVARDRDQYAVTVDSTASPDELARLPVVDEVAGIPRAVRGGVSISRRP